MTATLADLLRSMRAELVPALSAAVMEATPVYGATSTLEHYQRRGEGTVDVFAQSLAGEPSSAYADAWREAGYERCKAGVPVGHLQQIIIACNSVIQTALKRATAGDPELQIEMIERCAAVGQSALIGLYDGYHLSKEALIGEQQASIQELASPVLPILPGTLVVPLVGVFDAERADALEERVLTGIGWGRAAVVIVDLTGVALLEGQAAKALVGVARAAEFLGARVIFVGIRPEAASRLIDLGVSFGGRATLANLQAGIEVALSVQGLAVVAERAQGATSMNGEARTVAPDAASRRSREAPSTPRRRPLP